MMKKVFISYGTGRYKESLKRIGKEAKKLKIFSRIILYSEKDLPGFIMNSPLKAFSRGDGYWIWKPYIIWKTMQDYPKAIIVYADSGCTLNSNEEEWNSWFELLETYDTLVFQYRMDYIYPWMKRMRRGTTNKEWTKMSVVEYFDSLFGNRNWTESTQLLSGLVLSCRNSKLIDEWKNLMLFHPELVVDCFGNELENQERCFQEHRHDQSILSALSAYWANKGNVVKILPETCESCETAAVRATRIQVLPSQSRMPLKTRLILIVKKVMGTSRYERVHSVLDKSSLFRKWTLSMEHGDLKNTK